MSGRIRTREPTRIKRTKLAINCCLGVDFLTTGFEVSSVFVFKGGYREGFTILWIPALLTLCILLVARMKVPSPEKLETSGGSVCGCNGGDFNASLLLGQKGDFVVVAWIKGSFLTLFTKSLRW